MAINFEEINQAALFRYPDLLHSWLPGGKVNGSEYECGDISGGSGKSMKVNTTTGKWSDFAAGITGGDPVSLYAAIYNMQQIDAAKQLAADFNIQLPEYKPKQGKQKKIKWTAQPFAPPTASAPDFNHYKHGKPVATWEYKTQGGQIAGYICRFNLPDGKKEVLPICWAISEYGDKAWRWLSFAKQRPLYNLSDISRYPEADVILVEGEKCVDALRAELPDIPVCVVTWPGGSKAIKHADFTPLSGRKVVIWPDFDSKYYPDNHKKAGQLMPIMDQPGYKAAHDIKKIISSYGCETKIIGYELLEYVDGWDCADMISDNPDITPADIFAFIKEGIQRYDDYLQNMPDEPPPLDDEYQHSDPEEYNHDTSTFPFQFLGYDRGVYYYLSHKTKQVIELKPESHQGKSLLQLAPLSWWERKFPGTKTAVNWESCADFLLSENIKTGIFNPARIRGRGAWEDAGRSVLHTGGHLVVDGKKTNINDFETAYIYEVAHDLDHQVSGEPLTTRQANELAKLCERLSWTKSINAALLAGWCVIAVICGALKWRPHIWVTGSKGTGKTWILENIIKPTVGGAALGVVSSTTEAGIRQTLVNDARPVVFDEAEGEKKEDQRRIQGILELARQASSESASAIFKGTTTGRSMAFHIRSCFLFASIGVNITQSSDASRITILNLKPNTADDAGQHFEQLQSDTFATLTPEYCAALRARSVALIPVIRKNAEIFSRAGSEFLGSKRAGDQIGALLAGYYSLFSNQEITLERARDWIRERNNLWDDIRMTDDDSDEIRCLYAILSHPIKIQGTRRSADLSLGGLISIAMGSNSDLINRDDAESVIRNHGVRTDRVGEYQFFIISNTDPRIKRILSNTPWANGWHQLLQRIEGAEKRGSITFSPGVRSRGTILPAELLHDETEERQEEIGY